MTSFSLLIPEHFSRELFAHWEKDSQHLQVVTYPSSLSPEKLPDFCRPLLRDLTTPLAFFSPLDQQDQMGICSLQDMLAYLHFTQQTNRPWAGLTYTNKQDFFNLSSKGIIEGPHQKRASSLWLDGPKPTGWYFSTNFWQWRSWQRLIRPELEAAPFWTLLAHLGLRGLNQPLHYRPFHEKPVGALFLDRDGVLIKDTHYPHNIKDLIPLKKHWHMIKDWQQKNPLAKTLILTNQSGLARQFFQLNDYHLFQEELCARLRAFGIRIDHTYVAPSHPEGKVPQWSGYSYLRKPYPGMLNLAAQDFPLSISASIMVGDKASDKLKQIGLKFHKVLPSSRKNTLSL
jgi:D-glycero-D-manno-heptose 1,7-bisphosphate phosphatase